MRVYEILLPLADNKGKSLSGAHVAFQICVQTEFGGWTKGATVEGSWQDDKSGLIHQEELVSYHIAVEDNHAAYQPGVMSCLAGIASPLFPDQKAFYVAEIGHARIISNGYRPRQDRAVGSGKTDGAFEAKASDKSSTSFRPLELVQAERLFAELEAERVVLSAAAWGLSEALRAYRVNPYPHQAAALLRAVVAASVEVWAVRNA